MFRDVSRPQPAIVFRDEGGNRVDVSWSDLKRRVASLAATLRSVGVCRGDRVVAYMPNVLFVILGVGLWRHSVRS